jgi:RNA polymerase sigma-70 factor (ECF subfamily)
MRQDSNCLLEGEALRLAQQGNAAAFEFLYRRHRKRVYALCLRMVKDPIPADLTQETFLAVRRGIRDFRGQSTFTTWLHQVTRNTVLMSVCKRRTKETSLEETAESGGENRWVPGEFGMPDRRLAATADLMILQTAVSKLSRGFRTALLLHDLHGYEHWEVAAMPGYGAGTSKSQLHKARLRVRELLQKYFQPRKRKDNRSDDVSDDQASTAPVAPRDDKPDSDVEQHSPSGEPSSKPQRAVPSWCEPLDEKPRTSRK